MKKLIRKIKMSIIPTIIATMSLIYAKATTSIIGEELVRYSIEGNSKENTSSSVSDILCYNVVDNRPEPTIIETIAKYAIILFPILVVIAIVVIIVKKLKKGKTTDEKVEDEKKKE